MSRNFFLILVVLVSFLCLSTNSASFLDFLEENEEVNDTQIELHGINFTLPHGYVESKRDNSTDEKGITTEDYLFSNEEGYLIDISILYNGNIENYIVDDTNHFSKNLGNISGMASIGRNYFNFIYKVEDKQVSVLARNESIVKKVILSE